MRQPIAKSPQPGPGEKWAEAVVRECSWQSAYQWQERCAEQKEWWHNGHEQKMLHHVRGKQQAGKGVEWGRDGDPEDGESPEERAKSPCGKASWRDATKYQPSP
jgi:hypothetical protein